MHLDAVIFFLNQGQKNLFKYKQMKKYPSVNTKINFDVDVIGFNKIDGSNIRAFWKSSEKQFTEFGTRTLPLKKEHKYLGGAVDMIRTKYEKELTKVFLEKKYTEVTAFFEFYGKNSFAGRHNINDVKEIVLIDLMIYKKGLIHPAEFVRDYKRVGIPAILFKGKLNEPVVAQIKNGNLAGMSAEGVVFKGRGGKKGNYPIVFKVKSKQWIDKLKELCGDDEEMFKKLL